MFHVKHRGEPLAEFHVEQQVELDRSRDFGASWPESGGLRPGVLLPYRLSPPSTVSHHPDPTAFELQHLPQHNQPAAEVLDKGPGRFINERRGDKRRGIGAGRCSEEQDPATQAEKRLNAGEELLLHPHGPHADEVLRLVKLGPCKEVLRSHGLHRGVREVELAGRLAKERRFAGLGLHHHQRKRRNGDFQRDGRRAAAGPDVEQAGMRAKTRPLSLRVRPVEVPGRDQRLDEQPIDGLIRGVFQGKRGEIDLLVPDLEQAVIGTQGLSRPGVKADIRLAGPPRKPLAELPWRHG